MIEPKSIELFLVPQVIESVLVKQWGRWLDGDKGMDESNQSMDPPIRWQMSLGSTNQTLRMGQGGTPTSSQGQVRKETRRTQKGTSMFIWLAPTWWKFEFDWTIGGKNLIG